MNRSSPCVRRAVVYEMWPAARTIALQHRRRHDSFRISASLQRASHAGVGAHSGAWSATHGQCPESVSVWHAQPFSPSSGAAPAPSSGDAGSGGECVCVCACACVGGEEGAHTAGTAPGGKSVVLGSEASTSVRERLRMIESSMTIDDVERSVECRGCAHTSNSARSCGVLRSATRSFNAKLKLKNKDAPTPPAPASRRSTRH